MTFETRNGTAALEEAARALVEADEKLNAAREERKARYEVVAALVAETGLDFYNEHGIVIIVNRKVSESINVSVGKKRRKRKEKAADEA